MDSLAMAAEDVRPDGGKVLALVDSDAQDLRIDCLEGCSIMALCLCLDFGN